MTALTDSQVGHHLIRACLDGCKVNHLLRATDVYNGGVSRQVAQADQAILAAFEDLVVVALTGPQLAQVCLPFSAGGCGVRAPLQTRPAARVSGLLGYLTGGAAAVGAPYF